jgi:hypothetical protein
MGLLSRLFGGERRRDAELLSSLLQLQSDRIKADAEIERLDRDLRLQTKKLELENLERISEEKRKDADARERLRIQRREWAANARKKVAANRDAATRVGGTPGCVVCADPSSPRLTAEEILWHQNGHPGAMRQS